MSRTATILMVVLTALCYSSAMAVGKPMKVYVLAGQSNMVGLGDVKTFDYIGDDPATAPLLKEMRGPDGKPRMCEKVWISNLTGPKDKPGERCGKLTAGYGGRRDPAELGEKIGPEFTFGITMSKVSDGPILIIKTACGDRGRRNSQERIHEDNREKPA